MVNNYPEYAAGVNYKKTDSEDVRHFYSAQVVADPDNETVSAALIKDGVVIDEGGGATVEALNVTENGTYSEEGKAYSPVVVNVAGGVSDFTKANVAITFTREGRSLNVATTTETDPDKNVGFVWDSTYGVLLSTPDDPIEFDTTGTNIFYIKTGEYIVLYSLSVIDGTAYAVTGNAEVVPGVDESPAIIKVYGDCSITF